MSATRKALCLPCLERVDLRSFSLFKQKPNVGFDCGDGVVCLVGANGVGKSTLLAAINYGLTGIVPDPERKFESVEEYYRYSLAYAGSFFTGRIDERDREDAEVTLRFRVGTHQYSLSRGLFEPEELRSLLITSTLTGDPVAVSDGMTHREMHELYRQKLPEHVGLSTFEQFVFLQHFVFTFDEQRRTLLWDPKTLELVLYLTFGLSPDEAKRVDTIKRGIEHEDSRVRNYNWEATQVRARLAEAKARRESLASAHGSFDELSQKQESLVRALDEARAAHESAQKALSDASLKLADCSARESVLREEYAVDFDRHFEGVPSIAQHPLFATSLSQDRCGLCGSQGPEVLSEIERRRNASRCPLCGSSVAATQPGTDGMTVLLKLDAQLASLRKQITSSAMEIDRLQKAVTAKSKLVAELEERERRFEQENLSTLTELRKSLGEPGSVDTLIASHAVQLKDHLARKDEALIKRNALKSELKSTRAKLQKEYALAERDFVPTFTKLAHLFLGMDLQIGMDVGQSTGLTLVVDVNGTSRRHAHMLSESQRFFLDIALRMAITEYMVDPDMKGEIYIDTPEGSLDVAYEKRAGDMLSEFAKRGHRILMTANLNSSQLLLALARTCGSPKLHLLRMMDWAELSDVQVEEEDLFEQAFAAIQQAMAR
ncbi:MAG: AAA family ATPase [candidate division WOR-3 bacterium]|nr:AAA family ATPase [candidate division WOR-3 bacterium]